MKRTSLIATLAVLCCMALSSPVSAAGILAGEWGYGNFDRIIQVSANDIFDVSGGVTLSQPATEQIVNDTAATYGSTFDLATFNTWTVSTDPSGTEVSMSGSPLNALGWSYNFNTSYASTPFSFEFQAYNGDQLLDWTTISYNGGRYDNGLNNLENYSFTGHNATTVPEPATAVLLLFGMAATGMAGYRRKSLRK